MSGGISTRLRSMYAHRPAIVALIGIVGAISSDRIYCCARADDYVEDYQCAEQLVPEQSILVAAGKSPRQNRSAAAIGGQNVGETLEPIANVSKYVPDLAEPTGIKRVPDLAEPVVAEPATDVATVERREKQAALPAYPQSLSFHGVTPGDSNRRDVFREWGDPRNEDTTAQTLLYRFDKLKSVRVKFDGIMVDTIVVELDRPLTTGKLLEKLGLEGIRPAVLSDASGSHLARAYPERGVVFRYTSESNSAQVGEVDLLGIDVLGQDEAVSEIVIQPIRVAGFLLRAENYRRTNISQCLADLKQALEVDDESAHAHWLLSDLYLSLGQGAKAESHAVEATKLEPFNHNYRLQHARCLRRIARYEQAIEQVQFILESQDSHPLVRAQALHEMGLLSSIGFLRVSESAVDLHTKAIEIADELATSDDEKISLKAKELLVEAHLSMAVEIAKGQWERKDQTVPQWIERASAISEEMIAADHANLPLRLDVAVSALAAAASLDSPIDPTLWIEEAEETTNLLRISVNDQQTIDQYEWNLGLAYFHGLQIEHRRSEPNKAEHLGKRAVAKLKNLSVQREELPGTFFLMGRLYFQIGAIHAVHHEDHVSACRWYDQAAVYLLNSAVSSTLTPPPQQHGDALVSMGVSYWHTKRREGAIEVTQSGVDLIEKAVQSGLLESDALSVPYGNLAAMYDAQGEAGSAEKYEQLAKKVTRTQVSSAPSAEKMR